MLSRAGRCGWALSVSARAGRHQPSAWWRRDPRGRRPRPSPSVGSPLSREPPPATSTLRAEIEPAEPFRWAQERAPSAAVSLPRHRRRSLQRSCSRAIEPPALMHGSAESSMSRALALPGASGLSDRRLIQRNRRAVISGRGRPPAPQSAMLIDRQARDRATSPGDTARCPPTPAGRPLFSIAPKPPAGPAGAGVLRYSPHSPPW